MSTSLSQLTLFHFMTSAHFLQNASTAQRSSSPVSVCHTHTAACVMQSLVSVAATAKKPYSVYYVVQYRRSQAFCRQRRSHPPSKAATAGDVGTENRDRRLTVSAYSVEVAQRLTNRGSSDAPIVDDDDTDSPPYWTLIIYRTCL